MSRDPDLPDGVAPVKLWDPALRLFHWALAGVVITTWILGRWGPSVMSLHYTLGYVVIGLLAFRLVWGVFGPRPARFAQFTYGPRKTLAYAAHLGARRPSYWPGHNPMGALSVYAMLLLLALQVLTGLYADPEDYVNYGPLADTVDISTARQALGWHYRGALAIAVLVALHLAVIVFYKLWKREDLIRPMITGWKAVKTPEDDAS